MNRVEAIRAFVAESELEEKISAALSIILERQPKALLIFWEEDSGYGGLTLPESQALAYGLATKAYEMLVEDAGNVDSDGDDDSELDD